LSFSRFLFSLSDGCFAVDDTFAKTQFRESLDQSKDRVQGIKITYQIKFYVSST